VCRTNEETVKNTYKRTQIQYKVKDSNRQSVVSEHICNFGHSFDWNDVEILDVEHNFQKRSISEKKKIHIKEQRNGINLHGFWVIGFGIFRDYKGVRRFSLTFVIIILISDLCLYFLAPYCYLSFYGWGSWLGVRTDLIYYHVDRVTVNTLF